MLFFVNWFFLYFIDWAKKYSKFCCYLLRWYNFLLNFWIRRKFFSVVKIITLSALEQTQLLEGTKLLKRIKIIDEENKSTTKPDFNPFVPLNLEPKPRIEMFEPEKLDYLGPSLIQKKVSNTESSIEESYIIEFYQFNKILVGTSKSDSKCVLRVNNS